MGVVHLRRQVLFDRERGEHVVPAQRLLPSHGGMLITRRLQEWACLLGRDFAFSTAQRLLGWQAGEAPPLSESEVRRLVCRHGMLLREAAETEVQALLARPDLEGLTAQLAPAAPPRRPAAWPAALNEAVLQRGRPFLGICLGLQFLFDSSEEGSESGLGWLEGRIMRFDASRMKVPHIGWTEVAIRPGGRLFEGIHSPADFYFVHSYHAAERGAAAGHAAGCSEYGARFVSAIEKEHVFAVQFHPEKSQLAGMKLIGNFLAL